MLNLTQIDERKHSIHQQFVDGCITEDEREYILIALDALADEWREANNGGNDGVEEHEINKRRRIAEANEY